MGVYENYYDYYDMSATAKMILDTILKDTQQLGLDSKLIDLVDFEGSKWRLKAIIRSKVGGVGGHRYNISGLIREIDRRCNKTYPWAWAEKTFKERGFLIQHPPLLVLELDFIRLCCREMLKNDIYKKPIQLQEIDL